MKNIIMFTGFILVLVVFCKILFYRNNWPSMFNFDIVIIIFILILVTLIIIKLIKK